jgi:hypothetical protein
MIACRVAARPKGVNVVKGASKATLPLLLTKSAVRVTPKKLIGKPMGTAADEPSSFADSASGRAKDSIAAAAPPTQAKDKRIAVIRDIRKRRPPDSAFIASPPCGIYS